MFYFREGANYASVYTQSKIVSENIKWNLNQRPIWYIDSLRSILNKSPVILLFKLSITSSRDLRAFFKAL